MVENIGEAQQVPLIGPPAVMKDEQPLRPPIRRALLIDEGTQDRTPSLTGTARRDSPSLTCTARLDALSLTGTAGRESPSLTGTAGRDSPSLTGAGGRNSPPNGCGRNDLMGVGYPC